MHSFARTNASGLVELRDARHAPQDVSGNLHILAATPELRFEELSFDHRTYHAGDRHAPRKAMTAFLEHGLTTFAQSVDLVIFDCPPGFSTLAQAALMVSDGIISPIQEERSSVWTLKTFRDFGLRKVLEIWEPERHRVLYTRVSNQGAQSDRAQIRHDVRAAEFKPFDTSIKNTSHAHRWTVRLAPDSYTSFGAKYGNQASAVKDLGSEVIKFLMPLAKIQPVHEE